MMPAASPLSRMMEFTNLPTLPHILLQVLDMCNRDDASLTSIAELIGKDAALSSKVIGASNAPQFIRHSQFVSIEQNLALLGLDMVKTITISSSFYQVFNNLSTNPGFDFKSFWGRSLTSAVLSRLIAREMDYPHLEEAYFTGLMLDIGQLVLWSNFPKQYALLLADPVDDIQLMSLESEKLGNNHCDIGAWLVGTWNLNSFITDAVLYHHLPHDKMLGTHPLIRIAHAANDLATTGCDNADRLAAVESLLDIPAATLRKIFEDAGSLVNNMAQSLGIEIDTSAVGTCPRLEKTGHDSMRQQKIQLAVELRDNVLIGRNPLGTGAPVSLDDTLASIQRATHILFGFQNVAFFLPDQQRRILKGKCLSNESMLINEISIPLDQGNTLITDAYLSKTPSTSFTLTNDSAVSVTDGQIIRLMDREGIYCQPLYTRNTVIGIMVFGIYQTQLAHIKKQNKLLSMFAQQSAQAISLLNAFEEQEKRIKSEMATAARNQARQVAHEANNPLGIIKNYIHLMEVKLSGDDGTRADLKIIQEEIDRVSRILRAMTAAQTNEPAQPQTLNVNDVIRDVYRISFESLFSQHSIKIETRFDQKLPTTALNRDQLIQILVNLMKNAGEAMPDGGALQISTRAGILRNGKEYIEITLKDNGPGIPPQVMEHLFKPVSSTKGEGHAGLGLSIVKDIVDNMNGWIFCQSDEASGTAFQVLLPLKKITEKSET
jgi:nitrogen-specific signal transduction histidine kinase/HD-like signal output (HDOD) protein